MRSPPSFDDAWERIQSERVTDIDLWESDEQVLAWLVTSLRFDYLSFKQLRRVVEAVYAQLLGSHLPDTFKDKVALVKTEYPESHRGIRSGASGPANASGIQPALR